MNKSVLLAVLAVASLLTPTAYAKEMTWWEVWKAVNRGKPVTEAQIRQAQRDKYWDMYGQIRSVCYTSRLKRAGSLSPEIARSWIGGLEPAWKSPEVPRTVDELVSKNPGWSLLPIDVWDQLRENMVKEGCGHLMPPIRVRQ